MKYLGYLGLKWGNKCIIIVGVFGEEGIEEMLVREQCLMIRRENVSETDGKGITGGEEFVKVIKTNLGEVTMGMKEA